MTFDGNVGAGTLIAKPYPRIMFAACTRMPFPRAREGRLPAVSPGNPAYAVHREDACELNAYSSSQKCLCPTLVLAVAL